METRGKYTREEIFSQPESWTEAISILKKRAVEIQDFSGQDKRQQIIFTGCGSTFYLSCAAASLFQEVTGIPARGLPASELWLSPHAYYHPSDDTFLVAISRSGETTETIQACEEFLHQQKGRLITLVCDPKSTMAKMGGMKLVFPSAMERSIAQTRAFSTLYLGIVGMSVIWAQQSEQLAQLAYLPAIGRRILSDYQALAAHHGRNLQYDRIYFLGSGGRYGLACELHLKMKEMSLTHSAAYHFLEFRHGPKAMVNETTLVIGLLSESNAEYELALLRDIRQLGAEIVTIGERNADVSLNSGLEEVLRNTLYLPFGQVLAYERSIAKGYDPDHPNHLDSVVKLTTSIP